MADNMTDVALRDHLETQIRELDKRIDQRLCAQAKALTLQAKEYERRLEDLNHAHAQHLADRALYLPRETYTTDRRAVIAAWIAVCSLAVSVLTLIAVLPK